MASSTITTAGFCAGVGLLDLGVATAIEWLGFQNKPALYCEWDAYAAACLLARMEDKSLEPCPIWCGDLGQFDGKPFRGALDILIAGLPCQPYSNAGKRGGHDDHRSYGDGSGPLPQFLRIIGECRPAVVFLENVPAWVSSGWFRLFGEELSGLGYEIEDPLFITAESVGASHRRERVFVMAHDQGNGRWPQWSESAGQFGEASSGNESGAMANALRCEREPRAGRERVFNGGEDVAESERRTDELRRRPRELGDAPPTNGSEGIQRERDSDAVGSCEPDMVNASGERTPSGEQFRRECGFEQAGGYVGDTQGVNGRLGHRGLRGTSRGHESEVSIEPMGESTGGGIFAPGPSDKRWRGILAGCQWLAPAIKSGVRVLVDGCEVVVDKSRTDQLRCAGNACVPLCAAVAFVELFQRIT